MLLFLFAFISGLVTIAAPCIWPLLPIVLSASSTGGHRKPLGVTLGIIVSFGILTLTLSYIVKILPINLDLLRLFAVIVLVVLGASLIIPRLAAILELYVSRLSGKLGMGKSRNGFVGGLITGITLGIVWTPCAGPILATIATLAATTRVNSQIVLITIFYLIGVGIPLFLFSIIGRRVLTKTKFFSKYTGQIQRVFGVIMILTAILIGANLDKTLSAKLLDFFPSYTNVVNNFESKSGIGNLTGTNSNVTSDLFNSNQPAPQFSGITHWLNSDPLTMGELKGKVVLIDFWTYTCINCIRTLPHVESWYEKFKDRGFVVIGVHTPEFEFEKNTDNVKASIKQYDITYPVAQDNNYKTWNAYSNQYWPAEYLIDSKGVIRRIHFGEGEYDTMEQSIVALLKEAGKSVSQSSDTMPDVTPTEPTSPETYLGAARMQYLYPNGSTALGAQTFKIESGIPQNAFSYGGTWNVSDEFSTSVENGVIEYNFYANNVYLVMSPSQSGQSRVKILLDGKPISASEAGADVKNGEVILDRDRLYNLVNLHGNIGKHLLRIEFENSGIQVFAFTFG